jgi:hypothetical protein
MLGVPKYTINSTPLGLWKGPCLALWVVDSPVVRAPLGGCGHSGGVHSIPRSEGDLQASWCPQDQYGRWHSRGSSEGTLCALPQWAWQVGGYPLQIHTFQSKWGGQDLHRSSSSLWRDVEQRPSLLAAINTTLDDTNNTLYAAQQQIFYGNPSRKNHTTA